MSNQQAGQLTLISHKLCPYVQRSVIALQEQGKRYQRRDVDLENPPAWFLQLSPLGKVPLLRVDEEEVLFESAVIAEYINDIGDGTLLADKPFERARQRAWIEFASATLDNIGSFYSAVDEPAFERARGRLDENWIQLEKALSDSTYFSGESLSLVDAAFAPAFRYLDLFEQLLDVEMLKDYPRLSRWRQALAGRESVQKAVGEDYYRLLAEFIVRRNSWLAQHARRYLEANAAA
tara:strand:- start:11 stop:715 length:705 start_codon:yes stop_codon:yes gene_type:complete